MDQFYTKECIAKECIISFNIYYDFNSFDTILEPSAGTGSFYKNIETKSELIGIDLEPKYENIKKMNFFDFKEDINKTYLVIGNPPFGRVCSLAIKFFNRAAKFAEVIAFIIPRTFKRVSVQNKLDLNFNLVYTKDLLLQPCCFEPKMSAKCCFQIWERVDEKRKVIKFDTQHKHFKFISMGPKDKNSQPTIPQLNAFDFALKAYGSNCGEIIESKQQLKTLRPKSWHFIKCLNDISLDNLITSFKQLDYSISEDTVRQNSIGRGELVHLYDKHIKNKIVSDITSKLSSFQI